MSDSDSVTTYVLPVEARRVTAENIAELAEWCGGKNDHFLIWIATASRSAAHPGDWIVKQGSLYVVVNDAEFRAAGYVEVETEIGVRAGYITDGPCHPDEIPTCLKRWTRLTAHLEPVKRAHVVSRLVGRWVGQ